VNQFNKDYKKDKKSFADFLYRIHQVDEHSFYFYGAIYLLLAATAIASYMI
jgi:hypothetical protein